ncbi:MAG: OmpA family protein, partial [Bacteroidota bacterium]|nr:OmpA family protein [Bacteroidota bacterium]
FNNPVEYNPIRLSSIINTTKSEYFPTISADNSTIIFTRLIGENRKQEDIYIFRKNENKVYSISDLINTNNNEGAHTISADGKIIIFTRCTPYSGCDLFISENINKNKWSKPVKLPGTINSRYWESQPSLSPDGRTLYFTSNRPGGIGKMDIWKSTFIGKNKWSKPINLGDSVNTIGNEMSPFIHFDNKTLYFSSDYHPGIGKFDIFKSSKINDSIWAKPFNIGFPINTEEDEYRLVVIPSGKTAYLSSAVDTAFKHDIFMFNLDSMNKPERIIYLKVAIFDEQNKQMLIADNISVVDLNSHDTIFNTANKSNFLSCLNINTEFALNIIKKDYLFYSENFSLQNISDSLNFFEIDVFMKPIIENEKFILKNIFFETDSYLINQKSMPELNKFVEFMNISPSINIQINGHTDSVGTYTHNMTLSNKRALEIKKFLVNNGINKQRIKHKGFGSLQPKADNGTKIGRKLNRRIEILILKK